MAKRYHEYDIGNVQFYVIYLLLLYVISYFYHILFESLLAMFNDFNTSEWE